MLHATNTELRGHLAWIEQPPISAVFEDMAVVQHPTGPRCLHLRYKTQSGALSIYWTQLLHELHVEYEDRVRGYTFVLSGLCRAGDVPFRKTETVLEAAAFLSDLLRSNTGLLCGEQTAFDRAAGIAKRANGDYTRGMEQ